MNEDETFNLIEAFLLHLKNEDWAKGSFKGIEQTEVGDYLVVTDKAKHRIIKHLKKHGLVD